MSGSVRRTAMWARRGDPRLSAQAEVLSSLHALNRRKRLLMIEKEILAAERKQAVRQHKRLSTYDARLKAINAELLSIG